MFVLALKCAAWSGCVENGSLSSLSLCDGSARSSRVWRWLWFTEEEWVEEDGEGGADGHWVEVEDADDAPSP